MRKALVFVREQLLLMLLLLLLLATVFLPDNQRQEGRKAWPAGVSLLGHISVGSGCIDRVYSVGFGNTLRL